MLSLSARTLARPTGAAFARAYARHASTSAHKIVVVGGGTAGVTVAAQLQRAFAAEKRPLNEGDIAIVEPAKTHHCAFVQLRLSAAVAEKWRDLRIRCRSAGRRQLAHTGFLTARTLYRPARMDPCVRNICLRATPLRSGPNHS